MLIYKVCYKEIDYELKQNLNSIFLFEEITGKPFELKTTCDLFVNIYALFNGNNHSIDFYELKDYVDADFNFINQFYQGIVQEPDKKEAPETDKKK
jgi:hypothetical protein